MKRIFLRVVGYVLELEDGCYYVGTTWNLNQRLSQHWDGDGAKWTQLHKPRNLLEVVFDVDDDWENLTTLTLMDLVGREKVRGGCYCRVEIEEEDDLEEQVAELEQEADNLRKKIQEISDALSDCYPELQEECDALETHSQISETESVSSTSDNNLCCQ